MQEGLRAHKHAGKFEGLEKCNMVGRSGIASTFLSFFTSYSDLLVNFQLKKSPLLNLPAEVRPVCGLRLRVRASFRGLISYFSTSKMFDFIIVRYTSSR